MAVAQHSRIIYDGSRSGSDTVRCAESESTAENRLKTMRKLQPLENGLRNSVSKSNGTHVYAYKILVCPVVPLWNDVHTHMPRPR